MRIGKIELRYPPMVDDERVEEIREDISNSLGIFVEDVIFIPNEASSNNKQLTDKTKTKDILLADLRNKLTPLMNLTKLYTNSLTPQKRLNDEVKLDMSIKNEARMIRDNNLLNKIEVLLTDLASNNG